MPSIDKLVEKLGGAFERWFDTIRVLVIFTLGVSLIIYSAITTGHDIPFIVAGLILIGLVPVDQWLQRMPVQPNEEDDDARHPLR